MAFALYIIQIFKILKTQDGLEGVIFPSFGPAHYRECEWQILPPN